MELIGERSAIVDSAYTTRASSSRVTALNDEAWNQTVEDCAIVVAVQTMLKEVARCERDLFGEDLDDEVAGGGVEQDLGRRRRFEII
jgi:hypothetical protein